MVTIFMSLILANDPSSSSGKLTPATPDGRKAGERLSKNMAPNVGAETEGITGSIRSYGAIAPENFPCGSIYDVMIHPSTVAGEKGLRVFRMLVERFFAGGGVAMNINIVSAETLRDAQRHPEKYENLQVRVAGWNIRWAFSTRMPSCIISRKKTSA